MGIIYMNPNASADMEYMTRKYAAERGIKVMPSRPFPWNRKAYKLLEADETRTQGEAT